VRANLRLEDVHEISRRVVLAMPHRAAQAQGYRWRATRAGVIPLTLKREIPFRQRGVVLEFGNALYRGCRVTHYLFAMAFRRSGAEGLQYRFEPLAAFVDAGTETW
jgi:hypothetical protein